MAQPPVNSAPSAAAQPADQQTPPRLFGPDASVEWESLPLPNEAGGIPATFSSNAMTAEERAEAMAPCLERTRTQEHEFCDARAWRVWNTNDQPYAPPESPVVPTAERPSITVTFSPPAPQGPQ